MKTFVLFTLSLILSVFSQSIQIASPVNGTGVESGKDLNVMLVFPNSLTGANHISVVISLLECTNLTTDQCAEQKASNSLGKVLFAGNYTPQYHEQQKPPYQNFSVLIPEGQKPPNLLLTVSHFMLLGASAYPVLEFKNVTLAGNMVSGGD